MEKFTVTRPRNLISACLLGVIAASAGCQTFAEVDWPWDHVELPPPPRESAVFRAGHWEQESPPVPGTPAGDFASAKVLHDRGNYIDAEKVFRRIRKKAEKVNDTEMFEKSLFMEAEAQYAQRKFEQATKKYTQLLNSFPTSQYRAEVVERQFSIADYWLDDTRDEMVASQEDPDGFRIPKIINLSSDKPYVDSSGQAVSICQTVYTQDPTGPLAPKALFLSGGVNYYKERFDDADQSFSMLVNQFPKSELAPKAMELAIQSKVQTVGGPDYDSRKLTEARQLVDTALRSYPELNDKEDFLQRTLYSINEQQAEKDFNVAEFYQRTGHPGAAYFYYEIVRRRYPGTRWATMASDEMVKLKSTAN